MPYFSVGLVKLSTTAYVTPVPDAIPVISNAVSEGAIIGTFVGNVRILNADVVSEMLSNTYVPLASVVTKPIAV